MDGIKVYLMTALVMLLCSLEGSSRSLDSVYVNVRESYRELSRKHSASAEALYFKAFPDNAHEFLAWERYRELRELHSSKRDEDVSGYVRMLGGLKSVNDTLYCKKLVNLSVGASLDADGFYWLHALLHDKLGGEKLSKTFFFVLSGMTRGEQIRFWQFYWSSVCLAREDEEVSVDEEAERELRLVLRRLGRNRKMKHIVRLAYEYSSRQIYFVSSYGLYYKL